LEHRYQVAQFECSFVVALRTICAILFCCTKPKNVGRMTLRELPGVGTFMAGRGAIVCRAVGQQDQA
jgi:hypothetical protein